MSRTALIDGDEVAYKVALSYQNKYYTVLKDDKVLWKCPSKEEAIESILSRDDLEIKEEIEIYEPKGLEEKLDNDISRILYHTNTTLRRIFLSGDNNFRYSVATLLPYKGNRDPSTKPYYLDVTKDALRWRKAESVDMLEADDLLSINGHDSSSNIICSSDKDLRTVPSINFNIGKGELKVITKHEAIYNFLYQLLIGDSTDNIPSPFGLGDVKAKRILETLDYGNVPEYYYQTLIPFYSSFLLAKNKDGSYKTKWYDGRGVDEILNEIATLLWMKRTIEPGEAWSLYA